MKHKGGVLQRTPRLFVIFFALIICGLLLAMNIPYAFFYPYTSLSPAALWATFGFSTLISCMYLAVGSIVWLYARSRHVALLLLCFSCAIMVTFAMETGSEVGNRWFLVISSLSSALTVPFLSILLLSFPKNCFIVEDIRKKDPRSRLFYHGMALLQGYVWVLAGSGILVAVLYNLFSLFAPVIPLWLTIADNAYYIIGGIGILAIIIVSYLQVSALRERQQFRLFVNGVVISVAPFLLLTIFPSVLGLPALNAQWSTLSFVIFPIALSYSILRYQILVLDAHVRRTVTWIVGVISLMMLVYLAITICITIFAGQGPGNGAWAIALIAILAPLTWWLAKATTERLFFSEIRHYRRIIDQPHLLDEETLDVEEAARLLTAAAADTFEISQVCLFVLDESCGYFRIFPGLKDDVEDTPRCKLFQQLSLAMCQPASYRGADWLDRHLPALEHLNASRRPMLLSEAIHRREEVPGVLSRYLISTNPLAEDSVLLAPVRAQGKMIGLLALGERSDHQQYAGPDFEIAQLLITRFSSVLETTRLYAKGHQHTQLLNNLYNASSMLGYAFKTVEEISFFYAKVAAEAVEGRAEIWRLDEKDQLLYNATAVGTGPQLTQGDSLHLEFIRDWSPCFYSESNGQKPVRSSALLPSCVLIEPKFPFAWLPLLDGDKRLGILILTYPRPHLFVNEEVRLLSMFAGQCSAALENARMTIELQYAYERQKELDRLKDQFIITASHELRTPLTAVQGYIELLNEYNASLPIETRAMFISKAQRGCDELTLLVGNIMDASRVQIDAENVKLSPLPLLESITHVLEIMEAITRREERIVSVRVAENIWVMSDALRLRQVLLNLVTNAFKYSPQGTGVEVTACVEHDQVKVGVRDYGSGVPLGEQGRLFERFMRLDRDMNSPVRGAGLGLYICRQLVEAMGGRIWIESSGQVGEGSLFAFTLQLAPEVPLPDAQQEYQSSDVSLH